MAEGDTGVVWGYARDRESEEGYRGTFATRDEAVKEGKEEFEGEEFFVLCGAYSPVSKLVPTGHRMAEHLIENLSEDGYETWGEGAEDWPDVPAEALKELEDGLHALFKGWVDKYLKAPSWEALGEPEKIEAEPEDE